MMTLFKQHARTEAISVLIWSGLFGLVSFFTTYLWDVMRTSGSLADLEKALSSAQGVIKAMVNPGAATLVTINGWISGYVLGEWTSLIIGIFVALFVAGMITREMDRRTMEFVLSLPVSRARLLLSRWAVLACSLVLLHVLQYIGLSSALAVLGQHGDPGRYAVAELNSLLLYLFLGGLMLFVSLFIDDYGGGTGAMLGIGLGLNFIHVGLADTTGVLKSLRDLLPFSFYDVGAIINKGTVPWGDMAVLAGGALLFLALSVWVFERKQIAV